MNQIKYGLEILEETDMLDCKPVDESMDLNAKLVHKWSLYVIQGNIDDLWKN